jgi:uncharacterized protein (TIGR03663 family)
MQSAKTPPAQIAAAAPLEEPRHWLDYPAVRWAALNAEALFFGLMLVLAVVTRFYRLEPRVMSHDENSHVYYSWRLYKGQGFAHDPLMHGPFQFIVLAVTYFLFGDTDFTARIPAVLFSIAAVGFVWAYRRYLGRLGTAIAMVLMLISPYMLYYGRYVRNEAFIELFGVVTIWAILRYLETGRPRYLYWLTATMVLHFTTKETSFIYMAQALLFLLLWLIYRLLQNPWPRAEEKRSFVWALLAAFGLLVAAGGTLLLGGRAGETAATTPVGVPVPAPEVASAAAVAPIVPLGLGILALLAVGAAVYFALRGYSLAAIRRERSFDLLMLLGTLVLPQLTALPIFLAGWKLPTNASEVAALTTSDMLHMGAVMIPLLLASVVLGLWWNRRQWWINAAIWYGLFIVFYTTVFTNGAGFFTGMVGSLGYWLNQQDVNRGSQPFYYYWLIQVPVYEYLPALGSLLAAWMVIFGRPRRAASAPVVETAGAASYDLAAPMPEAEAGAAPRPESAPTVELLGFWTVTALIAYTIAGEKMPWLTVHITLPMILLSGWSLGALADAIDWSLLRGTRGWLAALLLPLFLIATVVALGSLLGSNPPFQGQALTQLAATSTFLVALLGAVAAGVGLFAAIRPWSPQQFNRLLLAYLFVFLAVLTGRTAFRAAYVAYDDANELLVYAHSAGGVKEALSQIEELSRRTSDGLAMPVAYDNETSYPYLWYLRNYADARFFGENPTRSLREVPAILVGDANYGKIEAVVGDAYDQFDYIRLWWPNQDYFGLTWERVSDALTNPQMRAALFQIWLNRDYTKFGEVTGKDMSLPKWEPSAKMRLYVRKDIAAKVWNYGAAPAAAEVIPADPYEGKETTLAPDKVVAGDALGLNRPRNVAVAPDGTLYVADTGNHRILHLDAAGQVLQTWGSYADVAAGNAPGGTFNEPWGVAVASDGSVYVADTWNHRIQKFSATGEFAQMWGYFGQAEAPDAFWGPRAVVVDAQDRVLVTDTGNKRIAIFSADGAPLGQFGQAGLGSGEFDEPVGLAVGPDGRLYVADTWNQRIQVFTADANGNYAPTSSWEIAGWYGQSLDNKPYLTFSPLGHLFVADPEGYRVLEFTAEGEIVRFWGDYSPGTDGFGLVGGLAADRQGEQSGLWVVDPANNRLLHFTVPPVE